MDQLLPQQIALPSFRSPHTWDPEPLLIDMNSASGGSPTLRKELESPQHTGFSCPHSVTSKPGRRSAPQHMGVPSLCNPQVNHVPLLIDVKISLWGGFTIRAESGSDLYAPQHIAAPSSCNPQVYWPATDGSEPCVFRRRHLNTFIFSPTKDASIST